MLLSAVPVFAEPLPYVIVSEFNDGEEMGAIVKDGNFTSYCVLYVQDQTKPEYMQFDLGEVMDVSKVALAFRNGTTRISTFHISVSEDGENFTTVVPKSESSGTTDEYEFFDINTNARYIRVYGYSNTFNIYWFSVTEAEVFVKSE